LTRFHRHHFISISSPLYHGSELFVALDSFVQLIASNTIFVINIYDNPCFIARTSLSEYPSNGLSDINYRSAHYQCIHLREIQTTLSRTICRNNDQLLFFYEIIFVQFMILCIIKFAPLQLYQT
jgi:hypothetical protein